MNYLETDSKIRRQVRHQPFEFADIQNEPMLESYLLQHQGESPSLAQFPYICAREYLVSPPYSNLGKGDLIFTDGQNRFLIAELKYLPPPGSGKSARTKRHEKRRKVAEQAVWYAEQFRAQHPDAEVFYAAITNENPLAPALQKLDAGASTRHFYTSA